MFSDLVANTWKVPDFGGQFFPIFGQEKYKLLSTTVRTLFGENSSNMFYLRLSTKGSPKSLNLANFGMKISWPNIIL